MSDNPLLQQLGYAPDARLVVFHADDVGMLHGANQAYLELQAAGISRSGSVMIPCPWSEEVVRAAVADPALDLGIHVTLNSDLRGSRWQPLSTRDPASGLVDCDGWFWARPEATLNNLHVDAAAAEMRAQVAWAHRNGLDFTHIDTHMGVAFTPQLLEPYIQLGFDYRVPVLLTRRQDDYTRGMVFSGGDEAWREVTRAVEARGMPLVDTFRITPGYDPLHSPGGDVAEYEKVLRDLPSGITYFAIHPNAPGAEIEAVSPDQFHWRTFEHAYFQSQRLRDFLAAEGIIPIGMREIRDVMRRQL